jgi:SAM-dependent methyltransferase
VTTSHQSHIGDEKGQTDSLHKMSRLKYPDDLTGKTFLDIGCNEGFFCGQALVRNAKRVLGIDFDSNFLSEAIRRYPSERAEYQLRSWLDLPDEKFDMIVWSSAMHYELDPISVLRNIANSLEPDGLFVLECGVVFSSEIIMHYAIRQDNGHWYPTQKFIENGLVSAGLSFRMVSSPELVGNDPVHRVVYHCRRLRPSVLLIVGDSGRGKTSLAYSLTESANKVYFLDNLLTRIAQANWAHSPLQKYIKDNYLPLNLGILYKGIDESGLTAQFVDFLSQIVVCSDRLVVFEGYLTEMQVKTFISTLEARSNIWVVR